MAEIKEVKVKDLVELIRKAQEPLDDYYRKELWESIQEGYCKYCGSKHLPCYCWNCE